MGGFVFGSDRKMWPSPCLHLHCYKYVSVKKWVKFPFDGQLESWHWMFYFHMSDVKWMKLLWSVLPADTDTEAKLNQLRCLSLYEDVCRGRDLRGTFLYFRYISWLSLTSTVRISGFLPMSVALEQMSTVGFISVEAQWVWHPLQWSLYFI